MPRGLRFCFAIVAAFQLHAAAASPVEEAPITPPVAALAQRLGIDPTADRPRFMAEVVRMLYANADAKPPTLTASGSPESPTTTVPLPLPASVWSRIVFRHTVPVDQLIGAILSDRRASLLCRGLAGLDDETLTFLIEHPPLLAFLYEQAAEVFGAFGANLRIAAGRVVPPGDAGAVPLWEAVIRAPVTDPERFVRILFGENNGRLAYLYDVIDAATPSAAAFALGLWITDVHQRTTRFRALAVACTNLYREWKLDEHPFARPLGDLAMLLLRIRTDSAGAPSPPSNRSFWAEALGVDVNLSGSTEAPLVGGDRGPIDAAWLVSATGDAGIYTRVERIDAFAFGQRVFANLADPEVAAAVETLRNYGQHRMLPLTLERIGIRSPSVYFAVHQRAKTLAASGSSRRFWTLAQFQGAIALMATMHRAGTLKPAAAPALLLSLAAVPLEDGEYNGGLVRWIRTDLVKSLPPGGTWEERLLAALAGSTDSATAPSVFWEGQAYRVDLHLAERQRLDIVRSKQGGHTVDLAVALDDLARTVGAPGLTIDAAQRAARDARAISDESAVRLRHPSVNVLPMSVELPRDAAEWLAEIADDLSRIVRPSDLRRAGRVGASLQHLEDIVLGNALLSLAYAADIGDPDGAALLAGNVSLRHDFGFGYRDSETRQRMPWILPRQDFQPGVPWHVAGSALGLDVALASMKLRRMTIDRIGDAPKLPSLERDGFAVTASLLDPSRLKDTDRDAIAAAIGRGRERVAALVAGGETLEPVAVLLGFDGRRRRAIEWWLKNQPQSVVRQFSMVDLLTLGGGAPTADLDSWGSSAIYSEGCVCTRMPTSRAWRVLDGRPQFPMMAATMSDFNLVVALMLRDMNLPSVLAKPVLAIGMQDFIDDVNPVHNADWLSLSREAQGLTRRRTEDYVSTAAAVNGPLVPEEPELSRTR